ncbi:pseudouridine synthase [bacterium]|nr:pseudouridine synthase [bacterium]
MGQDQHFKLYKPAGYLSQFVNNQNRRRNKKLLSELGDFPEGTMSVGRLDENSEGLLFLTTDGKTSNYVQSKNVEKEYYVQVEGKIDEKAINEIQRGVEIKLKKRVYTTLPAKARILETAPKVPPSPRAERDRDKITSWISITIKEGKYRQVRKMTAAVGFPTLRLIRVRIGSEGLENLRPGKHIELESFNV